MPSFADDYSNAPPPSILSKRQPASESPHPISSGDRRATAKPSGITLHEFFSRTRYGAETSQATKVTTISGSTIDEDGENTRFAQQTGNMFRRLFGRGQENLPEESMVQSVITGGASKDAGGFIGKLAKRFSFSRGVVES